MPKSATSSDSKNKSVTYIQKKGEEYMSRNQLAHFKDILSTMKKELAQDIDRTVSAMRDETTLFADLMTALVKNLSSRRNYVIVIGREN